MTGPATIGKRDDHRPEPADLTREMVTAAIQARRARVVESGDAEYPEGWRVIRAFQT